MKKNEGASVSSFFYDSFCFQPIKTGYMLCINIREEMRQCIRIYRENSDRNRFFERNRKAIAERFGKERMNVVVNYLGDSAGAEEAADIIEKAGGRAVTVKADVSSEEGIQALFHAAQEHFGAWT